MGAFQVAEDLLQGPLLVGGELVGKALLHQGVPLGQRGKGPARGGLALGLEDEEAPRQLLHVLTGPFLGPLPLPLAQGGKLRGVIGGPRVALEEGKLLHGR